MSTTLWIDAADFREPGGWTLDTQFTHHIGAATLMATGIGTPVADARHELEVPAAGRYRLWVLARNWLPEHTPGTFEVLLQMWRSPVLRRSATRFGAQPHDRWTWEDGGTFDLPAGRLMVNLHDCTGYYGRCGAIVLTTDLESRPPDGAPAILAERLRLRGLDPNPAPRGGFDLIVAGAGIAGICAALAAARNGLHVALLQDRPMVGGNASRECGVSINGAAINFDNARESGLVEEIAREEAAENFVESTTACERLLAREPRVEVFTNQRVVAVDMETPTRIAAVRTLDCRSGLPAAYEAPLFVDATGDGWVGFYAGAEFRFGREGRDEFGESLAPPEPDPITMSGCIMGNCISYRAEALDEEAPYTPPPWAPRFASEADFGRHVSWVEEGNWWMEHAGTVNDLDEPERARDELIRITFGYWDYVKNVWSGRDQARGHRLVRVPHINARREGRRLVGDYMLTQKDVQSSSRFPDRVSYGGWALDIHHAEGIYSGTKGPFEFWGEIADYTIPYRCLYSRTVENLFLAGRAISVTHVALGTVRVMATLGTLGQAVGTAAALCREQGVLPRGIYEKHMAQLQQRLLRHDQYIPDLANEEAGDLARCATVEASSTATHATHTPADAHRHIASLPPRDLVLFLPAELLGAPLDSLHLFCAAPEAGAVQVHAWPVDEQPAAVPAAGGVVAKIDLPAGFEGFAALPVAVPAGEAGVALHLQTTGGVRLAHGEAVLPGVQVLVPDDAGALTPWGVRLAFHTRPVLAWPADYAPANAISGISRTVGTKSHLWVSDPGQPLPQSLTLTWDQPQRFDTVQLTFDTDMHAPRCGHGHICGRPPECVRDYDLAVRRGGAWETLLEVRGNCLRHRIHPLATVEADALRLTVTATHGAPSARVYEVRVYQTGA